MLPIFLSHFIGMQSDLSKSWLKTGGNAANFSIFNVWWLTGRNAAHITQRFVGMQSDLSKIWSQTGGNAARFSRRVIVRSPASPNLVSRRRKCCSFFFFSLFGGDFSWHAGGTAAHFTPMFNWDAIRPLSIFLAELLQFDFSMNVWWLAGGNAANFSLLIYYKAIWPLQILATNKSKCCPFSLGIFPLLVWPFNVWWLTGGNAAHFTPIFNCSISSR